ncbi:hypothetical protein Afil01_67450 [Actinorhabdospora filicis]|uniref:LTD domain-containing protein n=1 Tax=Actinorhabdospora filicis TaxID=1785913 RepID=A0A9W6WDB2_9ACTN|nr:lamin tail domain-containing protein [Actinorhabdospora filicis]GLZ81938.1 hypothetical protein Afil01_67450 [Actinorhabdospora filicis]
MKNGALIPALICASLTPMAPVPATPGVVISEAAPAGPGGATDEYLELRNPTASTADVSGWRLAVCSAPGLTTVIATLPPGTSLAPGARRLLAGPGFRPRRAYAGGQMPDLRYGADVSTRGGWLLTDASGVIVDGLGLGPGLDCTEGEPAPACAWASGEADERDGLGPDSDRNAVDFRCARATPGG